MKLPHKLQWLSVLNSPFKRPKLKFYLGKLTIGVPYYFPRRWVKDKEKPGYLKVKPLKVGFSKTGLGFKTKWTPEDFRFEWSPMLSFVFFGWQAVVWVIAPCDEDGYWTCWLTYHYATDKSKSRKERIIEARKKNPQIWIQYKDVSEEEVDYWELSLKRKYL